MGLQAIEFVGGALVAPGCARACNAQEADSRFESPPSGAGYVEAESSSYVMLS